MVRCWRGTTSDDPLEDIVPMTTRTAALLLALPLALAGCSGEDPAVDGPTVEVTPGPLTTPDLPEVESPEPEAT